MAGKAGEAFVEIVPELSKFGSQLSSGVEKEVASKTTRMGQSFQQVGAGLTAGVTLPLVGLGIAATKAFQETAAVQAQTAAGIKSTGGAANVTAAQVEALAGQVSNYAAVDDEAVQAGENLLLTFTKVQDSVGKGRDIFTEATKAGADLAARGMGSIESNAVLLGKALNDPIAGIGRLSKVGVNFTASQEKTITALAEGGETAKAQGVILDEVFRQVGGSAKAFGESAAGESAKGTIAMGEAMESLGESIAPLVAKVSKLVATFANWFANLDGPWKTAILIGLGVLALLGPALLIIGTIMTAMTPIATAFGGGMLVAFGWVALIAIAIVAVIALVVVIVKNFDTIKRVALAVWNAIKGFLITVWRADQVRRARGLERDQGIFRRRVQRDKGGRPRLLQDLRGPDNPAAPLGLGQDRSRSSARISEHWREVWSGLVDFVGGIWDGIVRPSKPARTSSSAPIESAVNAFLQPFQTLSTAPIIGSKIPDVPEIRIRVSPREGSSGRRRSPSSERPDRRRSSRSVTSGASATTAARSRSPGPSRSRRTRPPTSAASSTRTPTRAGVTRGRSIGWADDDLRPPREYRQLGIRGTPLRHAWAG